MLRYSEFETSPLLRPLIECIWILKSPIGSHLKTRELIIPGGRAEMIFNFGDPMTWIDSRGMSTFTMYDEAFILGPRNRYFFVDQTGFSNIIGVRFRHGGLSSFTDIPVQELLNQVVTNAWIFGKLTDDWMPRLLETTDDSVRIRLVETFLTKLLRQDPSTDKSLALISFVKRADNTSIQTITDKTGIHYKKLERIFSRHTGYGPKNFKKVIRFYESLRSMKKQHDTLTGIGLDHGYHDQPHFIRDFKTFTGKSPSQFYQENPTIANFLLQSKYV